MNKSKRNNWVSRKIYKAYLRVGIAGSKRSMFNYYVERHYARLYQYNGVIVP